MAAAAGQPPATKLLGGGRINRRWDINHDLAKAGEGALSFCLHKSFAMEEPRMGQ